MDTENEKQSAFADEDVYPLHALDNNPTWVNWVMRFNDALDAQKLHDSLSRLLDIGDWRKLGGRIRRKSKKTWEIHVQNSSAAKRENVSFSHATYDMRIQDHPVAKNFPKETDRPSIHPIPSTFRPFIARAAFPTFEEVSQRDIAPIFLHVTSFRDATIAALVWPHVLMDVMSGRALLAAWSSVLAGREDEVPTVLGAREDILQHPAVTADDDDEFILEKSRLTGLSLIVFQLRSLWDMIRNGSRERRVIFLPKTSYEKLKTRTRQEVATLASGADPAPFMSESDILTAWATRAIALSEPHSRSVVVMSLLNLRFRIPLLLQSTGVFLQNMVLGTYAFFSSPIAKGPLGPIALGHRQHVAEQGTEQQLRKFLKAAMTDIEAAELMKAANFAPAVITQGETTENRTNALGTMVNYFNETLDNNFEGLNIFVMLGKDHAENYWFMGTLLPRAWDVIEGELRNLED
ncbi:uncharacterized protein N7477_001355 [Penicillium maclennaniae]|uniref:uncharacterized protein n=1 Tax=Penicillium maclennaniae TaxID=1343394 RepID=UPI00254008E7|nr:uncharacterized protein N7477_001355 [Penicillium maclennaniae]KAJ5681415.1 hypothetical protein N7477_001355 [Penicillium maclennaniae]